jgi:TonB family protein
MGVRRIYKLYCPSSMKKTSHLAALLFALACVPAAAVPPYKVQRAPPDYPEQARRDRVEGTVVVQLDVKPDGSVANLAILTSTPPVLFDEAARTSAMRWHFQPLCGTRFGQSFSTKATLRFAYARQGDATSPPVFTIEDESSRAANPCVAGAPTLADAAKPAVGPEAAQEEPTAPVRERAPPAL